MKKSFGSDNYSGVCPEVMESLLECNSGHQGAYGNDDFTKLLNLKFKEVFGEHCEGFTVYNGTGANILCIKACTKSYNSVICSDSSHLHTNETGAPETNTGCKLITIPNYNGKIRIDDIQDVLDQSKDNGVHSSLPKMVSIANCTEYGTVYDPKEIKKIADFCHSNNLLLHVDGCRIFNACVYLNLTLKELTSDCGVDIMSLGGTKNGLMFGESVLFFNSKLAKDFEYLRKNELQLHSKMRYISVQLLRLLTDDLWFKNAKISKNMCSELALKLQKFESIIFTQPVESNHIFATFPKYLIPLLQEVFPFYVWNFKTSEIRLVTSWDTSLEDVNLFCKIVEESI